MPELEKPDRGFAWLIVFCCCFVNFAFFGIHRSYGVIFVALLQEYNVNREEASWPLGLCSSVLQLTGPFASVLAQFTTVRKVSLAGAAIATFGIALCFFAQDILWIKICYGVIHGFGVGLVVIWIPITISQYFKRNRATAMGLSFAGATLGGMLTPSLIEFLLREYGLNGTFLISSGITMNVLVAFSLIRPAPWANDDNKEYNNKYAFVSSQDMTKQHAEISVMLNEIDNVFEKQCSLNDDQVKQKKDACSENLHLPYTAKNGLLYDPLLKDKTDQEVLLAEKDRKIIVIEPNKKNKSTSFGKNTLSIISNDVCKVLRTPYFYLFTISTNILFLGIQSFFVVVIDYAHDKGISEPMAIYVLSIFSFTDLFGRTGLGWITDRNYVSRKTMLILDCLVTAVSTILLSEVNDFALFATLSALQGIGFGSALTLIYVIQMEHFHPKHQAYVLGLGGFVGGLATFLRPPMVGLFRDTIGSYDWMFYFTGSMYLIVAIIWTIEQCYTGKAFQKNKNINHEI